MRGPEGREPRVCGAGSAAEAGSPSASGARSDVAEGPLSPGDAALGAKAFGSSGSERRGRGFWQGSLADAVRLEMRSKYAALREALAEVEPRSRDRALRAVAARWPGVLREAQRVGPAGCQARELACDLRIDVRSDALTAGAGAIVLWPELHALLRDGLRFRAARGIVGDRAGPRAFLEFVAREGEGRWPPTAEVLVAVAGPVNGYPQAVRWLAYDLEMSVAGLEAELFGTARAEAEPDASAPCRVPPG